MPDARIIALVAAVADNGVIGRNNELPWHIPADLRYFKKITMGKPIVMGRRTFDSIGKALPGRLNIVVTRDAKWAAAGVRSATTFDAARALAADEGGDEIIVIGGGAIYALALPLANRIYLTQIHADLVGDTYFPALDARNWRESGREDFPSGAGSDYPYSFVQLDRGQAA